MYQYKNKKITTLQSVAGMLPLLTVSMHFLYVACCNLYNLLDAVTSLCKLALFHTLLPFNTHIRWIPKDSHSTFGMRQLQSLDYD